MGPFLPTLHQSAISTGTVLPGYPSLLQGLKPERCAWAWDLQRGMSILEMLNRLGAQLLLGHHKVSLQGLGPFKSCSWSRDLGGLRGLIKMGTKQYSGKENADEWNWLTSYVTA